jgi:ABC-type transport system involved in multi-copper enzyme maturation permease subunit
MTNLIRAELFKLRTTSAWWIFAVGAVLSTVVPLVINVVNARALLKPFSQYVSIQTHGHGNGPDAGFLTHLHDDWIAGHNAVTQASTIFTSGQLLGVLLTTLLGIVLVTSEYYQQTATTTFLLTPHRTKVVAGKLITGVLLAAGAWLLSTVISVVTGVVFLHSQGYGSQLGNWSVDRAILLNLAAYAIWTLFGIGLGALIRSQLGATVTATVLYLAGAAAASSIFDLLNTYVIKHDWILAAQVIVPAVASSVMISPVKTFTQSPPEWVGAAILIGYGLLLGGFGLRVLRRQDIA